jgi:uncharacterized protein
MTLLSIESQELLLKIARQSIIEKLHGNQKTIFDSMDFSSKELSQKLGAFVTLHKDNLLRGCIGRMTTEEPLYKTVFFMAQESAFNDARFPALKENEVNQIKIEISVLSPFEEIKFEEVEIGKHGLLLKNGYRSGVFLPQVPVEQSWTKEEFLFFLYKKAGVDFTKENQINSKLYSFTAFVFSEE